MGAHQNAVQRAVVFAVAVVCTLLNGTLDGFVGMTIHNEILLLIGFWLSMDKASPIIQKNFSNIAIFRIL